MERCRYRKERRRILYSRDSIYLIQREMKPGSPYFRFSGIVRFRFLTTESGQKGMRAEPTKQVSMQQSLVSFFLVISLRVQFSQVDRAEKASIVFSFLAEKPRKNAAEKNTRFFKAIMFCFRGRFIRLLIKILQQWSFNYANFSSFGSQLLKQFHIVNVMPDFDLKKAVARLKVCLAILVSLLILLLATLLLSLHLRQDQEEIPIPSAQRSKFNK